MAKKNVNLDEASTRQIMSEFESMFKAFASYLKQVLFQSVDDMVRANLGKLLTWVIRPSFAPCPTKNNFSDLDLLLGAYNCRDDTDVIYCSNVKDILFATWEDDGVKYVVCCSHHLSWLESDYRIRVKSSILNHNSGVYFAEVCRRF